MFIVENPYGSTTDIIARYNMEGIHIFDMTTNKIISGNGTFDIPLFGDSSNTFYPSWNGLYISRPDNDYLYNTYGADFYYKSYYYYYSYGSAYSDKPVIRTAVSDDGRLAAVATNDGKIYAYYYSSNPGWYGGDWILFGEKQVNGTVLFIDIDSSGKYITVLTEVEPSLNNYGYYIYVFKVKELVAGNLDAPTIYVPEYVKEGSSVTINWTPVSGADRYRIEIDRYSDFSSPDVYFTNETSITIDALTLYAGDTYYVRVRAENTTAGVYGNWSTNKSFVVYEMHQPSIMYPDNGTIMASGDIIEWSNAIYPDYIGSYEVQIATDSGFNNIVQTATVSDTSYKVQLEPGDYYVRVRPVVGNNAGDWSEPVKITVTSPATIQQTTPITNVMLVDGAIVGSGKYIVVLATNETDWVTYLMIFTPLGAGAVANASLTLSVPMPGAEKLARGEDVFAVYDGYRNLVRIYEYKNGELVELYSYTIPSEMTVKDMAIIGNNVLMLKLYDYSAWDYVLEIISLNGGANYTMSNLYLCSIAAWRDYGAAYIENSTGDYLLLFDRNGTKVAETPVNLYAWSGVKLRFGPSTITLVASRQYVVYSVPDLSLVEASGDLGKDVDDAIHFYNYTVYISGGVVVFPRHRIAMGTASSQSTFYPEEPLQSTPNLSLVLGNKSVVAVALKSDGIYLAMMNESEPVILKIPGTYKGVCPSSTYDGSRVAVVASGSVYVYVLSTGSIPAGAKTVPLLQSNIPAGNSLGGTGYTVSTIGALILVAVTLALAYLIQKTRKQL